ncbi:hypothetical protein IFM89_022067 [Coptis chinensis]|uniref:MSP domain-containing protein n=1 Tax=Coptis chinensis TaxID=261450 RepID=A0A835HAE1_9MAGN|nr:hypothetical protein IFM89_022067 [Coptis chinensis]
MMENKLVELSDQEVHIDFKLGCKCRANVRVTSLSTCTPVLFKVQTSSPHKFLVNPPTGFIPPLSYATFQIILKPQTQLPSSFPRSPSDRFLIKTAEFRESTQSEYINSWFNSQPHLVTFDVKLKVAYVGVFLFRHAIHASDVEAVKNIVKRQKDIVTELTRHEMDLLIRLVNESDNSDKPMSLLSEAGFKTASENFDRGDIVDCQDSDGHKALNVCASKGNVSHADYYKPCKEVLEIPEGDLALTAARRGDVKNLEKLLRKGVNVNHGDQYGLTALHAAAIKGYKDAVLLLTEAGMDLECHDKEGHTALHLAVEGGNLDTVELLVNEGANVNVISKMGATPLYMANVMGYDHISRFLSSRGASSSLLPSCSSS